MNRGEQSHARSGPVLLAVSSTCEMLIILLPHAMTTLLTKNKGIRSVSLLHHWNEQQKTLAYATEH